MRLAARQSVGGGASVETAYRHHVERGGRDSMRKTPSVPVAPHAHEHPVHPRREDHRKLGDDDRKRFNEALQLSYDDGSYRTLAAVHEDMSHRMHSIMGGGYIGGQRFLPWHRIYLPKMENLLRTKRWGLTIPYWN